MGLPAAGDGLVYNTQLLQNHETIAKLKSCPEMAAVPRLPLPEGPQMGQTGNPTFVIRQGYRINVLGKTTFTWGKPGLGKPLFGPAAYLADEVRVQVLVLAHEQ